MDYGCFLARATRWDAFVNRVQGASSHLKGEVSFSTAVRSFHTKGGNNARDNNIFDSGRISHNDYSPNSTIFCPIRISCNINIYVNPIASLSDDKDYFLKATGA